MCMAILSTMTNNFDYTFFFSIKDHLDLANINIQYDYFDHVYISRSPMTASIKIINGIYYALLENQFVIPNLKW